MAVSKKVRASLPAAKMGIPSRDAYPMPDRSHAANAKARAAQQVGKSITPAQEEAIDAKANKILYGKRQAIAKQGK